MLDPRLTVEHCNTALPPDSAAALHGSFECTFCQKCIERCRVPYRGDGFVPRPLWPAPDGKGDRRLDRFPAATWVTHTPVDVAAHAALMAQVGAIAPARR